MNKKYVCIRMGTHLMVAYAVIPLCASIAIHAFWSGVIFSGQTTFFAAHQWLLWIFLLGLGCIVFGKAEKLVPQFSPLLFCVTAYCVTGLIFPEQHTRESWVYALGALLTPYFFFFYLRGYMMTLCVWMIAGSISLCCGKLVVNEYWGQWTRLGNGINPNMFDLYSALTFCALAALSGSKLISLLSRVVAFVGSLCSILCVAMSMSRSASLAVLISSMLLIGLHWRNRGLRYFATIYLVVGILAFSSTILFLRGNESIKDIKSTVTSSANVNNPRVELWKGACRIIAEHPLQGVGESGWKPALVELNARGVQPDYAVNFDHAHNEILNTAAKYGLPCAALYLLIIVLALFNGVRSGLQGGDPLCTLQALCAVGMLVFGMFEVIFHHAGYLRINVVVCLLPMLMSDLALKWNRGADVSQADSL